MVKTPAVKARRCGFESQPAAIFFRVFSSIFKFIKFIKMCELRHSKIIVLKFEIEVRVICVNMMLERQKSDVIDFSLNYFY